MAKLLEREDYIGNTVNCKTYRKSYKDKRKLDNLPEKQLRFENTHEPIVDLDTWEAVQRVREGKRRPTRMGEMDKIQQESKKELSAKKRELEKCNRRIIELNGIFKKLYEDRVADKLTEERYAITGL